MLEKNLKRLRRHKRITSVMKTDKPRLVVFRSIKHIYAQVLDPVAGKTLAASSDLQLKASKKPKKELAKMVGTDVAKKAIAQGITTIIFDRAGFRFHGRIKELAEGARKGGLKF